MTETVIPFTTPVNSCAELRIGDYVEARSHGQIKHRGRVTEIGPPQGVFWIMDEVLGGRRLLDCVDFLIYR